jgi:TRAP-type transport system small permease protein
MTVLLRLIGLLAAVNRPLLALCRVTTISLAGAIAVIVAAAVFWRYILNDALSWSEEVAKYAMLWLAFIGAPVALEQRGHVAIEILPSALPQRGRHALLSLAMAVASAFLGLLVWYGSSFAWNGRTQVSPTVGSISLFWIFVAMPVGGFVLLTVALEQMLRHLGHALAPETVEAPLAGRDVLAAIE